MTDTSSVEEFGIAGHDRVVAAVQDILRTAQAMGYDDARLEGLSRVKARTIRSYRVEGKQPAIGAALSIVAVLGDWAVNRLMAVISYQAQPLEAGAQMQPNMIVADVAKDLSVLAVAAADGRFDHTEMPSVTEAADHIIATVLPLSRAGRQS